MSQIGRPRVRDPMTQKISTCHRSMVQKTHSEMFGNVSKCGCKMSVVELEGAIWRSQRCEEMWLRSTNPW
jgi:hypothetical protein